MRKTRFGFMLLILLAMLFVGATGAVSGPVTFYMTDLHALSGAGAVPHPEGDFSESGARSGPGAVEYYWDLGGQFSEAYVVVSTDHLVGDRFTFDVLTSNDLSVWNSATYTGRSYRVMESYGLDTDDFATLWSFNSSYRYLGVQSEGGMVLSASDESFIAAAAEFDGVAVPEPGTLLLLGSAAIAGLVWRGRSRY